MPAYEAPEPSQERNQKFAADLVQELQVHLGSRFRDVSLALVSPLMLAIGTYCQAHGRHKAFSHVDTNVEVGSFDGLGMWEYVVRAVREEYDAESDVALVFCSLVQEILARNRCTN